MGKQVRMITRKKEARQGRVRRMGKRIRKDKKNGKEDKNDKKSRKNKKKDDGKNKKGRSGKSSDLLPEFAYNQLWCFDLAMEQALEKCVEDKLINCDRFISRRPQRK